MAENVSGVGDVTVQDVGLGKHRELIQRITERAQDDLYAAISCVLLMSDPNSRREHLEACLDEFMRNCLGKVMYAKQVALLTPGCGVSLAHDGLPNRAQPGDGRSGGAL